MSANLESMSNTGPSFAGEALGVISHGALGAGIGFICAKFSKTNVVAAVIIGGCQGLTEATLGKVVKHCLGEEARSAKLILAVGNCLIGTIATIASVAFGVMSISGGVVFGVFVFVTLGWELFKEFKPEQAKAITDFMSRSLVPQQAQEADQLEEPAQAVDQPKDPEQEELSEQSVDLSEEEAEVVREIPLGEGFEEIDLNSESEDESYHTTLPKIDSKITMKNNKSLKLTAPSLELASV
jgi:hypothetical protein